MNRVLCDFNNLEIKLNPSSWKKSGEDRKESEYIRAVKENFQPDFLPCHFRKSLSNNPRQQHCSIRCSNNFFLAWSAIIIIIIISKESF